MRGTAVRPLTSTCAGGPEADETSSMSMSVSMSMSMLGTRPQRVGVFLSYVGRSTMLREFDLCGCPQRALLATRGADMHMVLVCKSRNSFSDALLPPTRPDTLHAGRRVQDPATRRVGHNKGC